MGKIKFKKNGGLYKKSKEEIMRFIEKIIENGVEKVITETFSPSSTGSEFGVLLPQNLFPPDINWKRIKEEVFVSKKSKKRSKKGKK